MTGTWKEALSLRSRAGRRCSISACGHCSGPKGKCGSLQVMTMCARASASPGPAPRAYAKQYLNIGSSHILRSLCLARAQARCGGQHGKARVNARARRHVPCMSAGPRGRGGALEWSGRAWASPQAWAAGCEPASAVLERPAGLGRAQRARLVRNRRQISEGTGKGLPSAASLWVAAICAACWLVDCACQSTRPRSIDDSTAFRPNRPRHRPSQVARSWPRRLFGPRDLPPARQQHGQARIVPNPWLPASSPASQPLAMLVNPDDAQDLSAGTSQNAQSYMFFCLRLPTRWPGPVLSCSPLIDLRAPALPFFLAQAKPQSVLHPKPANAYIIALLHTTRE